MKLLLTNDDGIESIGIRLLAESLAYAGHDVLMVAPDKECSGCGHAMTLGEPLELNELELNIDGVKAFSCDGLPTDCVVMGVDVLKYEPDVVISGINQGPNLADDLTYSGTACAAMEGVIFGIPSIAVSLDCGSRDAEKHNAAAAEVTLALLDWTEDNPMAEGVFYNVNVPNLPLCELKGVLTTVKGVRRYVDKIKVVHGQSGKKKYIIGGKIEDELTEGTDVWAVSKQYVSVTPVHLEMTCFTAYDGCKELGMCRALSEAIGKKCPDRKN
jgi:5'-nucleotidase